MVSTSPANTGHAHSIGAMLGAMLRRLGRQTLYLLTGLPLATAAFVAVVVGLSLGVGLAITVVGFLVLAAALLIARVFAIIERARLVVWMQVEPAPSHYRSMETEDSWFKRMTLPLRDGQSWLDAAHAIVAFPVAIGTWTIALTWWAVTVGGLSYPLWGWSVPDGPDNEDLPDLLGLGSGFGTRVAFWMVTGAVAAVTLPWVIAGASWISASLGEVLLMAPGRRAKRIDSLVEGRDASRTAEQISFRRLERDIHDGPQQRLVRLSMDLGRTQRKAREQAPELADAIDDARRQTHETLDELRALSRGIAPPILVDRGLERALEELAVRSALPTDCVVDLAGTELDDHVESAVYFVASEALANSAKHSGATRADLRVAVEGSMVTVVVSDDGNGGASPVPGHGLAGLQDRATAAGGELTVTSPTGGPTVIVAELPCGS